MFVTGCLRIGRHSYRSVPKIGLLLLLFSCLKGKSNRRVHRDAVETLSFVVIVKFCTFSAPRRDRRCEGSMTRTETTLCLSNVLRILTEHLAFEKNRMTFFVSRFSVFRFSSGHANTVYLIP